MVFILFGLFLVVAVTRAQERGRRRETEIMGKEHQSESEEVISLLLDILSS